MSETKVLVSSCFFGFKFNLFIKIMTGKYVYFYRR